MIQPPLSHRHGIPFFHNKTEAEFTKDIYERYDEMVTRQTALHLADELWNGYPMQPVMDFITTHLQIPDQANILELGCSVGRLIGTLAQNHPNSTCWGIDYSYQLLKRAHEFWRYEAVVNIDHSFRGMEPVIARGTFQKNLRFGLAKAEALPFHDITQDIIFSSFLLDRLQNPIQGLKEMYRVLKSGGQMILISPLNFNKAEHWKLLYPPASIKKQLENIGFDIDVFDESLMVIEPMDIHGNVVLWKCLAVQCSKA